MFYSPLRYPGGKRRLAKFISMVCASNDVHGHYVEPYAGGASVALHLLFEKKVSEITINDFDRSIYAFWHSVLNNSNKLCKLIEETDITIENWKIAKSVLKNKDKAKLLELGFSTFFLNRTNRSGIINAGVIGGKEQKGDYKIDCRFNKTDLIQRIKNIADLKENINLYNKDAEDLIREIQKEDSDSQTIYYFDPPYYVQGSSLYENHYKHLDHRNLSNLIKKIENSKWIISYDNTSQIKNLYDWANNKIEYELPHTANKAKIGSEVIYYSNNLEIQKNINPLSF